MKRAFMSAVSGKTLELLVYEQIGIDWWDGSGISAGTVAAAIKAAGPHDQITVRINSPGGSAFDGVAIFNLLRSQGKPITVFIDGIAASAASVIAMAGDDINIGVGAMLMIHNAMWGVFGDAPVLRKAADDIEAVSVAIGEIYVNRTKNDAETVKALMNDETWMSGAVAVEKGFATALVNQSDDDAAQAKALAQAFNLKQFKQVPKDLKERPANANPGAPVEETSSEFIPDIETYKQRLALRERAA